MSWDKLSNESNKIDKKQVLEERKKEKEKNKILQDIKESSTDAESLYSIAEGLCYRNSDFLDKDWAREVFQLCEELIHKQYEEHGELYVLLDIAKIYLDQNYLGEKDDLNRAEVLYKKIDTLYKDDLSGEGYLKMANAVYNIDSERAADLYNQAIKSEENPYLLMSIGDSLGKAIRPTKEDGTGIYLAYDDRALMKKAYKKAFDRCSNVDSYVLLATSVGFKNTGDNRNWAKDIYKVAIEIALKEKSKEGLEQIAEYVSDFRWGNDSDWADEIRAML
ncbi:MAG: hypothetical protein HOK59_01085 [Candidatus Marinimicrobia bacterium]|jgi:hypothetical protein|nr:hypothetical protein [Candidatus Neomarinimicrobiota bacterium]